MRFNITRFKLGTLFLAVLLLTACGGGGGSAAPASGGGTTTTATAPTITSFSPASGAPGTAITIVGTNFSATAANNTVKFNGVAATVTSATATSLVATVPATATTGTISVTAAAGTGTSASSFSVTASLAPATLTLSAPFTSLPGLVYSSASTPSAEVWANTAAGTNITMNYTIAAAGDTVAITITAPPDVIFAGTIGTALNFTSCAVINGTNATLPACSTWGIAVNRAAGMLTLTKTPLWDLAARTGTADGSFSFTPF